MWIRDLLEKAKAASPDKPLSKAWVRANAVFEAAADPPTVQRPCELLLEAEKAFRMDRIPEPDWSLMREAWLAKLREGD